jgi:hypothetical protein
MDLFSPSKGTPTTPGAARAAAFTRRSGTTRKSVRGFALRCEGAPGSGRGKGSEAGNQETRKPGNQETRNGSRASNHVRKNVSGPRATRTKRSAPAFSLWLCAFVRDHIRRAKPWRGCARGKRRKWGGRSGVFFARGRGREWRGKDSRTKAQPRQVRDRRFRADRPRLPKSGDLRHSDVAPRQSSFSARLEPGGPGGSAPRLRPQTRSCERGYFRCERRPGVLTSDY